MKNSLGSKKTQTKLIGVMILLLCLIAIFDVKGYVGGVLSFIFVFLCGDLFILPIILIMLLVIPLLKGNRIKFSFANIGAFLVLLSVLLLFSNTELTPLDAIDQFMVYFKASNPPLFKGIFDGYLKGGFIGYSLYAFLHTFLGSIITNILIYLTLIFSLILAVKPVISLLLNHIYDNKTNKDNIRKEKEKTPLKEYDFVNKEQPLNDVNNNSSTNKVTITSVTATSKDADINRFNNFNNFENNSFSNFNEEPVNRNVNKEPQLFEDLSFGNETKDILPSNEPKVKSGTFSIFDDDLGFGDNNSEISSPKATQNYNSSNNVDDIFGSHSEPQNLESKITNVSLNEDSSYLDSNNENTKMKHFDPMENDDNLFGEEIKDEPHNEVEVKHIRNDGIEDEHREDPFDDYIHKQEVTSKPVQSYSTYRPVDVKEVNEPVSSNDNITNNMNIFKHVDVNKDEIKEEVPSIEVPVVHEEPVVKEVQQKKPTRPYKLPPITLLNDIDNGDTTKNKEEAEVKSVKLNQKLNSLGINAKVCNFIVAPSFTRFEIEVASDVKLSSFNNIKQDIMMALSAEKINILAPIPGTSFVGIEIPNVKRTVVSFKEVFKDIPYNQKDEKLLAVLGKDISGESVTIKINKAPHLLIAGTTGSGKSVCMNTIIASLLMRTRYDEVKMILVDPKRIEMAVYSGIPHLLCPVINDPIKATIALRRMCEVMDERYGLFEEAGPLVRDIERYNKLMEKEGKEKMPYIVMIIDELSDLMMIASKDVEDSIRRITQLARAAGIHLIVATQRPSVDVITGVIKANIPSRIAFATSNNADSRTILDGGGAEDLLGRGDSFVHMAGDMNMNRVQGAYVSDDEIERIVDFVREQRLPDYDPRFTNLEPPANEQNFAIEGISTDDDDDLYNNILEMLKSQTTISTSFLQRRFSLGFPKAGRMIDRLEKDGYISPSRGSKPREVYQDRL